MLNPYHLSTIKVYMFGNYHRKFEQNCISHSIFYMCLKCENVPNPTALTLIDRDCVFVVSEKCKRRAQSVPKSGLQLFVYYVQFTYQNVENKII